MFYKFLLILPHYLSGFHKLPPNFDSTTNKFYTILKIYIFFKTLCSPFSITREYYNPIQNTITKTHSEPGTTVSTLLVVLPGIVMRYHTYFLFHCFPPHPPPVNTTRDFCIQTEIEICLQRLLGL